MWPIPSSWLMNKSIHFDRRSATLTSLIFVLKLSKDSTVELMYRTRRFYKDIKKNFLLHRWKRNHVVKIPFDFLGLYRKSTVLKISTGKRTRTGLSHEGEREVQEEDKTKEFTHLTHTKLRNLHASNTHWVNREQMGQGSRRRVKGETNEVYYETRKRELKRRLINRINEGRCDERLKGKLEQGTL